MNETIQEMLAGLGDFGQRSAALGELPFLLLLILAVAAAVFISFLYLQFYSSRATGSDIYRAFPLLGLSVTAIFICIQFSLPLSLGLLGALSIVRFRTPIKEPEEIGFIMLVIASALACATGNIYFLMIILGVALVTLLVGQIAPSGLQGPSNQGSLVISIPAAQYEDCGPAVIAFLEKELRRPRLESITRSDDEAVLALSFKSGKAGELLGLEAALRKIVKPSHFAILYDRPAGL